MAEIIDAGDGGRPRTSPRVYYFKGRAYYTPAAYHAAVASFRASQEAQRQAAQQRQLQSQTQLRNSSIRTAQQASNEAAASEALSRSAQVRRQQELARIQAEQQRQLQRAAQLRSVETRRLVEAGRRRSSQVALERQVAEQREVQRRAAQERLAARRREAYDALQRETARSNAQWQAWIHREEGEIRRIQEDRARDLQRGGGLVESARGGFAEGAGGRNLIYRDRERQDAVTQGETTGDWSDAVDLLDRQSRESGGRYVDENLMASVTQEYVTPVIEVGQRFEEVMREAERLFDREDMDGLRSLVESREFKRVESLFAEYYGDGRKPGSFAKHAQALTDIAQRRERLWLGLMLDPSGRTTSEEDIRRLLEEAERKSKTQFQRGGLQEGADFSGTRDLTYTDTVLDPETGDERRVVHHGLDAYLAREAARTQDAQREAFQRQTERLRTIRLAGKGKGRPMAASVRDGRLVVTDVLTERAIQEAVDLLPDGQSRYDQIVNASSPAEREELVRNFLRDLPGVYDQAHGSEREVRDVSVPYYGGTRLVDTSYNAGRTRWLTQIKKALLGPEAGNYGIGDELAQTGLGDIFRGMMVPFASAGSWLREQRAKLGEFNKPTFDISLWSDRSGFDVTPGDDRPTPDGWNIGPFHFGTENDPNAKQAYEDFLAGMASNDPNVRAQAQRNYGLSIIGGNAGWVLEAVADPLNWVTPAAWLNRARLATAAIGGARQLGSARGLSSALLQYARYSAPEALWGFGSARLRTDLAKMALAREAGVSASDMLRFSDQEIRDLAVKASRNIDDLAKTDAFKRLLEKAPIDKEQLLNIIQDKLPGIVDEFRLLPVDPFEMQARIRAAREGFERAEQMAREASQLEARRIAQAEAREALERVRVQAGTNVGERVSVSASNITEHERLLASYVGATREYADVARRASRAADQLDIITAAEKVDRRRLVTVHGQLKQALDDMRKFEDDFQVRNGVRELQREGLVARRYRELAEYRMNIGGDPSAPSYVNLSWRQVRQDRRLLVSRIKGLQRALRSTKDETEMARIRQLLVEAHKARAGVEFEAALLDHGRSVARTYGKRHMDRVGQAVRPQRLAAKATNDAERAAETGRDLSNRIGSIAEVEDAPALSAAQAKHLDEAEQTLAAANGGDIESWVQQLIQTKPGAKFAGVPATEALGDLHRLAGMLGLELKDLSLADLMLALYRVQRNAVDKQLWAPAWKLVQSRVGAVLRRSQWRGSIADFIEQLSWGHVRRGAAGGLARHEAVDKAVADALFELRKFRAQGQVRGGAKRYGQPELRELLRPDDDPAVVLAKIRTLRAQGMDLFEYDASRGVLRDIMLRRRTSAAILRDAQKLATDTGISVDEAFLKLRDQRARLESLREFEEFAARVENQGRAPEQILRLFEERYVGRDLGTVPGLKVSSYQESVLRSAWAEVAGFEWADEGARRNFLSSVQTPPLGDRSKMRQWLVDNGYWAPRTGDQIASGERVWSIDEERAFFEKNWGYTPPWTDPDVLRPMLNDQRVLRAAFEEWGFFDDGFESLVGGLDLTPEQTLDAVVWGRNGFAGKRTLEEMRRWVVQRYGPLAGRIMPEDGRVVLDSMPWLMRADDEYLHWINAQMTDWARAARAAEWQLARDKLPAPLREAVFDGDQVSRWGLEVNRGLVKPAEIEKLNAAIVSATRRRLERLRQAGDLEPGDWLPQERLRFAYDVANELLADPKWRGLLRGTPVAGTILNVWGQFWRMLVSFQPAFPIMNLIESFGFKRLYLSIFEGGFLMSRDVDGRRLVESLRQIGAESASLFHLADGANPWMRVGDKMLPANLRLRGLARGIQEAPLQLSRFGEDHLRLDFARSVAGNTYRAARKSGMDVEAAEALARAEARRMVGAFFFTQGDAGWIRALNQLVPFLSYNFNNKKLAMRMIWEHPAIIMWGERLSQAIKDANREAWAETYGDAPFPEDDPSSSWLWIQVGDEFYTVDLSAFSDWTRALKDVADSQNAGEWVSEFVRVPHPSQLGMLALLTGGTTPWGKPGHIRELSFWADLLFWMNGVDYQKPEWRRNWIQISSQMLFFKKFGRITPLKAKIQQYFWFKDLDASKAQAYLAENPDLGAWLEQFPNKSTHWYARLTDEERADYDASFEEWEALNNALDARIAEFANQPWSEEYRAAKREAHIARTVFLQQHPILPDSWGVYMEPSEFAALEERWRVDELADAWFRWERPRREAFKSDLSYQRALVSYYEDREAYLKANPALAKRLLEGRNAVENAWREHELQWADILQFQAKLKVRILEEQERPEDDQDRDFVDLLYRVRDAASLELDGETYSQVYGATIPKVARIGMLRRVTELPGFSDFIYGRSTPEERKAIRHNEWYAEAIGEVVKNSTDGKTFYEQLFKNPALLQEYWRRNPDAKARYEAGREYFRWLQTWVGRLQADDFAGAMDIWNQMPAWVRERYLAAHPDSGMADGAMGDSSSFEHNGRFFKTAASRARFIRGSEYFAAIGRWVELLKAEDFVAADRYFRNLPEWMREKYYDKHPEQRAQRELDSAILRKGAEYFLARGDDKLAILRKYPDLRAFLAKHGGDEAAMRGLVSAIYRAIPSEEAWLKRAFRERFPEVFSQEAIGERRLADVAADLARNPEMQPFYDKAFAIQSRLYQEQLKLSKAPPKPWSIERKRRLKKRRKRRAARFHSAWAFHNDLRRGR